MSTTRERFKCPQCGLVQWRQETCRRCGLPSDAAPAPPEPADDPPPPVPEPAQAAGVRGEAAGVRGKATGRRLPPIAWVVAAVLVLSIVGLWRGSGDGDDGGEGDGGGRRAQPRPSGSETMKWAKAGTAFHHGPRAATYLTGQIEAFDLDALDHLCPYRRGDFVCHSEKIAGEERLRTHALHSKNERGSWSASVLGAVGTVPHMLFFAHGKMGLEIESPSLDGSVLPFLRAGKVYEFERGQDAAPYQPRVTVGEIGDSRATGGLVCQVLRLAVHDFAMGADYKPRRESSWVKSLHVDLEATCEATSGMPAREVIARYCIGCELRPPAIRHPLERIAAAGRPVVDIDRLDEHCPETPGERSICLALQNYFDGEIEVIASADPDEVRLRHVNDAFYDIVSPPFDVKLRPPYRESFVTGTRHRYDPMAPADESIVKLPQVGYAECQSSVVEELRVLRWIDQGLKGREYHVTFEVDCGNFRRMIGRFQYQGGG